MDILNLQKMMRCDRKARAVISFLDVTKVVSGHSSLSGAET